MARKKIREYDGKRIVTRHLTQVKAVKLGGVGTTTITDTKSNKTTTTTTARAAQVSLKAIDACGGKNSKQVFYEKLAKQHEWLLDTKLVVKPDMLFGKRGKNNLILLNADYDSAQTFINERLNQSLEVSGVKGIMTTFLIEPFIPHSEEFYLCIQTVREGEQISFGSCGGIEIEDNWDKVKSVTIPCNLPFSNCVELRSNHYLHEYIMPLIQHDVAQTFHKVLLNFIEKCYETYIDLDMTLFEMNPFTVDQSPDHLPVILDTRVELDSYALFKNAKLWKGSNHENEKVVDLPEPWGLDKSEEEKYIESMDEKSSASLKLTILNPKGHIWTMVAGGGASVIYTDQVVQLGYGDELGNYAEYSGNPKEQEMYLFSRTLLSLLTKHSDGKRKALLCGGGVANFSDVSASFAGLQQALTDFHGKLQMTKVKVFVRRGGPNYKAGLQLMRDLGNNLDIPIEVYGPEMDMTNIVSLGIRWIEEGV